MNSASHVGNTRTVLALLVRIQRVFEDAGVPDARRHAEWLVQEATGEPRAMLYAYPDRTLSAETLDRIDRWVQRRCAGEPIQYILGSASFRELRLRVSPDVLIPRPETEEVVEDVLSRVKNVSDPHVLDVGTGSGCIALAVKHARPDATVCGADNSERALDLARANADELGLDVQFVAADMLSDDFPDYVPAGLDLIVCNPPYVLERERSALPREVLEHEPHQALFSGEDPLRYYRALLPHARALLRTGGWLVMEIHEEMGERVERLLSDGSFSEVCILPDLSGKDRIAVGRR